jgi:hypothetical protein
MASAQNTNTIQKRGVLETLYVGIVLVIFAGIVLHAPFSVGFGVLFPEYDLVIKSWKEILMGLALVLAVYVVTKYHAWRRFKTPLFWLIGGFAVLNLVMIPVFFTGFEATIAGLFINLRAFLFFVLVYVACTLYPSAIRLFVMTFFIGAAVVIGFALLQVFVLPYDILKYIGYGPQTIVPYLTVDQNMDYIRINSTLRGPNPLGAYALIVLSLLVTAWLLARQKFTKPLTWAAGVLAAGSVVALWVSYARSAALGAIAALGIIFLTVYRRNIHRGVWVGLAVFAVLLTGTVVALKDTQFVSQVILHEDPEEGGTVNSNDGHAESLAEGTGRMLKQPLGAGIGSTGSASLLGDAPFIVENQYLFVAHEVGWPGLILFVLVYWFVLRQLWRKRKNWFALGVFASGIGLAVIGVLLPVFVDETVAIIWWGLAAVGLALPKRSEND